MRDFSVFMEPLMIKVIDPITCGYRVKKARLLAGLSRRALEERFNISASTIQSWEIARNPLTLKGAKRLIEVFKEVGLFCTVEWLINGEGISPRPYSEVHQERPLRNEAIIDFGDEESIRKEILFFQENNFDSIVLNIIDDAMSPQYSIGDYAGGKRRYNDKIFDAIGMNCIVQLNVNEYLLRKISAISPELKLTLSSTNPGTTVSYPILYNQTTLSVAPIIWHRKKNID